MSTDTSPPITRITRTARLEWVPISRMRVSQIAQREFKPHWVNKIIAEFQAEWLGVPTLNLRDGYYYIVDGQHRVEALRSMGMGGHSLECFIYEGLTESEEAELFLRLNFNLAVDAFNKFTVGVTAHRAIQTEIQRIVEDEGLRIGRARSEGCICAVGTLTRVFRQTGGDNLGRTLRVINAAYGDLGLTSRVIDGIGLLLHRYEGQLDDARAITSLANVSGGLNGLLSRANLQKTKTSKPVRQCVAAAAVEIVNGGRGGRKLRNWWSSDDDEPRLASVS